MPGPHEVVIHSDGACSGNPGPGGWSACMELRSPDGTHQVLLRGGDPGTTNNAMGDYVTVNYIK